MQSVDQAMIATIRQLRDAGIDNPRLDARLLIQEAAGMEAEDVARAPDQILADDSIVKLREVVLRRKKREPISRIVGRREFWSLPFAITSDVLDPRPDSETLIDALLDAESEKSSALTIADLGTGSGCLLCAALNEFPNARGVGIDKSREAIKVARRNSHALGLKGRAHFLQGQWSNAVAAQSLDVILTNPPYIPSSQIAGLEPEVSEFDPRLALDGGRDGLDAYRAIAREIGRIVKPGGVALIEIGAGQAKEAKSLFENERVLHSEEIPDLSGQVRCLKFRYKKNGT